MSLRTVLIVAGLVALCISGVAWFAATHHEHDASHPQINAAQAVERAWQTYTDIKDQAQARAQESRRELEQISDDDSDIDVVRRCIDSLRAKAGSASTSGVDANTMQRAGNAR